MRWLELKVPPVALSALLAAAMYGLAHSAPVWTVALPGNAAATVATALGGLGVAIALAGVVAFRRSRTTVNPHTPQHTSSVVTHGVYRWTRNPMYLGMLLVLAGWALFLANAAALAGLPAFVAWMSRFQIQPEERILAARFGAPFTAYMAAVRRWI